MTINNALFYIVLSIINALQIYGHKIIHMPRGKPKTKTAVMTLRVEPVVKSSVELAAKHDRRSVTSLIEVLILKYCEEIGVIAKASSEKEII